MLSASRQVESKLTEGYWLQVRLVSRKEKVGRSGIGKAGGFKYFCAGVQRCSVLQCFDGLGSKNSWLRKENRIDNTNGVVDEVWMERVNDSGWPWSLTV